MSRWIALGLATGVRTTRFPDPAGVGDDGAPSAVACRWRALTPEVALAAADTCPTRAITATGSATRGRLCLDVGACIACGRCVSRFPEAFSWAADPRVAVRARDRLTLDVRWGPGQPPTPAEPTELAEQVRRRGRSLFRRSLHIRHVDAGSCNGCEAELQMLTTPYVDLSRLGLFFTPTPRHADVLLVTGVVTRNMEAALRSTYEAMPGPKLVVASGACAVEGGCFAGGPMTQGPLDRLLPVDVYVPGCPPTPQAVLHGLLLAIDRAAEHLDLVGAADGP